MEDSLYLLRSSFILEAKNRIVGSLIGQIDIGRKDLTLEVRDDRFFIKENQLFIKKSLENVTVSGFSIVPKGDAFLNFCPLKF